MNNNEIDYKQQYQEDMKYVLDELIVMQTVINSMYSIAHKLNVNIDTMECLTTIKQGFDLTVNNVKKRFEVNWIKNKTCSC